MLLSLLQNEAEVMALRRNVAGQKMLVYAVDRGSSPANTPKTGDAANITANVRKDYGSPAASNDTNPTEIGGGLYEFDLTQAETDCNVFDFWPVSATSGVTVIAMPSLRLYTFPANWDVVPILSNGSFVGEYSRYKTAQAGAAGTITLDASASATDDAYNDLEIEIITGTGAPQVRRITDYVGSTKVATVDKNWLTIPDNTSVFAIRRAATVKSDVEKIDGSATAVANHKSVLLGTTHLNAIQEGTAQAGASTTITLATAAINDDDRYNGNRVWIVSGTGAGQVRNITDYVGSSRVATVEPAWTDNPDNTSVYAIMPDSFTPGVASTGTTAPWVPRCELSLTTTAGTAANLRVWIEDGFGAFVDVAAEDATATAEITVTEHDADGGSVLFTQAFADTDQNNGGWEKTKSTPGFTADRQYVVAIECVIDSITYNNTQTIVVFG